MQEIEKLKLLAGGDSGKAINLDVKTVMQVVADSSRYNVYQLVDSALLGDTVRSQKILTGLRNEGIFPLVILAAICRELRALLPMLEKKTARTRHQCDTSICPCLVQPQASGVQCFIENRPLYRMVHC